MKGNRYGEEKVDDYYPCVMIKEYPLNKLPVKTVFLKDLEEKEDE
jgi:hypothetical protein